MPLRPTLPERLLFRFDKGPGPVLDLFGAGAFEAVLLADDVGVLDALSEEPRPLDALVDDLDADPEALAVLLAFLATTNYVVRDGDQYRATRTTRRWLSPANGTDMRPWLRYWRDVVFPFWREHMATALRDGEPPLTIYEYCDEAPGRWELTQRAFRSAATLVLDDVADAVTVPDDAERLLDVGGGHGLYAIELCRRHGLDGTIVDGSEALDVAREAVADAELSDRIDLLGADYLADDLGDGYDLALVFNVVHAHDVPTVQALFERVAGALAPDGRILVLDQLAGSHRLPVARAGVQFAALTYVTALGGRVHSYRDLADALEAAGFTSVSKRSLWKTPGVSLVEAALA